MKYTRTVNIADLHLRSGPWRDEAGAIIPWPWAAHFDQMARKDTITFTVDTDAEYEADLRAKMDALAKQYGAVPLPAAWEEP